MMSRFNGSELTEHEHIFQSLEDIASTPFGSRIMRREYGTQLANFIDQPISQSLYLKCYSSLYAAFLRWENRIEISQIIVAEVSSGKMILDIEAILIKTGDPLNFQIPVGLGVAT